MSRTPSPLPPVKRLESRDLRVPVTAGLRHLPPAERERRLALRRQMLAGWSPVSERTRRRLVHYVVGAAVFLPLLNWLLTPLSWTDLWFQVPIAALYGLVQGWWRFDRVASGALLVTTAWISLAVAGRPPWVFGASSFIVVSTTLAYFVVGLMIGAGASLDRSEGV